MPLPSPLTGELTQSGIIVGDSFGDYAADPLQAFPTVMDFRHWNDCTNGNEIIVDIEPVFSTTVSGTTHKWVCMQGGVNDISASKTATQIQTAVSSMITTAQAANLEIVICNVAPWKAHTNWTADKQTEQDAYNSWLASNAATLGFTVVDIFTLLEGTADTLNAAYDRGDGLHTNAAGALAIAQEIDSTLYTLGLFDTGYNMNTFQWKGAVEPTGAGVGGNVLKTWKGAVEPAVISSSADALIGGVTRSVTKGLTRGVTEDWDWGA